MTVQIGSLPDLIAFLLPGFVGMQLYGFLVRTKKRDDFERFAGSLLLSLAAYCIAVWLVTAVASDHADSFCAVDLAHWPFTLLLFAIAALIAVALAKIIAWEALRHWVLQHLKVDYSPYPSVWNEIWHCPKGAPWAVVQLKDGTQLYGQIHKYSADPDETRRELLLFPVASIPEGDSEPEERPGLAMYVNGDEIALVSLYRK